MKQEEINHIHKMLDIHRRNKEHYLKQAEMYGGLDLAPPITRNGLYETEREIERYEKRLADLAGK